MTLLIQNAPPPEYHAFSKEVKTILNETRNLLGEKDIDQEKILMVTVSVTYLRGITKMGNLEQF